MAGMYRSADLCFGSCLSATSRSLGVPYFTSLWVRPGGRFRNGEYMEEKITQGRFSQAAVLSYDPKLFSSK